MSENALTDNKASLDTVTFDFSPPLGCIRSSNQIYEKEAYDYAN